MLTRVTSGIKQVAKVSALAVLLALGTVGVVSYEGARDRVSDTFGPPLEKSKTTISDTWDKGEGYADKGWTKIEENPIPIIVALLTLLLTIVYHKAKGKSFRQALETSITKVQTIELPLQQVQTPTAQSRAINKATLKQLKEDQKETETEIYKLVPEIDKAKIEVSRTENEYMKIKTVMNSKQQSMQLAHNTLQDLLKEQAEAEQKLTEIDDAIHELKDTAN